MNMYRVAKYDLSGYIDGIYTRDEWTNYSDIGKVFNGEKLTKERYLAVESNYIQVAQDIFAKSQQKEISIMNLQKNQAHLLWENNQTVNKTQLAEIIRDCLRNRCWCRLSAEEFYIHFGYDFYMYIGCPLSYKTVTQICNENQLYVTKQESPYLTIDQGEF